MMNGEHPLTSAVFSVPMRNLNSVVSMGMVSSLAGIYSTYEE